MKDNTMFLIITFILLISVSLTLILFYKSNSNGVSGTGMNTDYYTTGCATIQQAISGTYTGNWIWIFVSDGETREKISSLEDLFGEYYKKYIIEVADGFNFITDSNTGEYVHFQYAQDKYTATYTRSDNGKLASVTLQATNCIQNK